MPKLTIIALTSTEPYAWKALVEIDYDTVKALTRTYPAAPPKVGEQIDLGPAIERVYMMEGREEKVRALYQLLRDIAEPQQPKEGE